MEKKKGLLAISDVLVSTLPKTSLLVRASSGAIQTFGPTELSEITVPGAMNPVSAMTFR